MKKNVHLLAMLLISIAAFANDDFDKTINYQYNNARNYIGETLYLVPITDSWYEEPVTPLGPKHVWYAHFLQYDYDENDYYQSDNCTYYNYKFDPFDWRDYNVAGTHKRHIEGHKFYVDDVVQKPSLTYNQADQGVSDTLYEYRWIFYLTDLNTGDKLKYSYYGEPELFMFSFLYFPFITMKHYDYCKSLIGTNLVYATHPHSIHIGEIEPHYSPTFEDIHTGEKVQYSDTYAKWEITDAIIDKELLCISFIVTDGYHTIKIPYDIQYSTITPQPQYMMSKYSSGVRVFPEAQWNKLVARYGLKHMSLIMDTRVSDDMTIEEKYMAGGWRLAKRKSHSASNESVVKQVGSAAMKSTKEAVRSIKEIGKGLLGW